MEDRVRSFNTLARAETTPGGLGIEAPNHWSFGICHIDLLSFEDIVMVANTATGQVYQGGSADILSLPTVGERAEAAIPCLLDAFVNPTTSFHSPHATSFHLPPALWAWSTLDPDMARAIEDGLKKHGVLPALCNVGGCTAEEREFLIETREMLPFMDSEFERELVAPGDPTRCHGCRCKAECFFQPLRKCAGCSTTFYHSRECQKKHWKVHKAKCGIPGTTSGTPSTTSSGTSSGTPTIEAEEYYKTEARKDPEAQSLMSSLRLEGHPDSDGIACVFSLFELLREIA